MTSADLAFFERGFGLDRRDCERSLEHLLERRVDHAELFFECTTQASLALEEGIVKHGDRHLSQGFGARAVAGERQGYAHSDVIDAARLLAAARAARAICEQSGGGRVALPPAPADVPPLYPRLDPAAAPSVERQGALLEEIDRAARRSDSRIEQVIASLVIQERRILVAASDGTLAADVQPLCRLNVQVIARDPHSGRREVAYQGGGGRMEPAELLDPARWRPLVDEAVRLALLQLGAVECPAGSMTVVLGPGWPGILLHEAIGHGLEGDFNRKQTSAFSGRIGQRVAAPGVTVVDDGTLPGRRGSLAIDDEGTPSRRNVLIEDGILRGYLQDRTNARLMGVASTGNGRRESYAHLPLPRMTNTFMLAGTDDPAEILRSVPRGLYAVSFGGGQVDITSGKFVFSASEAYRIEDGRIGAPVKGATLIGNGPDVLQRVSRIGCDLELDRGVGTCGKEGQSVPVGVGLPTLRIEELTVGGTQG